MVALPYTHPQHGVSSVLQAPIPGNFGDPGALKGSMANVSQCGIPLVRSHAFFPNPQASGVVTL